MTTSVCVGIMLLLLTAAVAPAHARQDEFPPEPRIDSIFAEWDRSGSPGCALGIIRDGSLNYARGYGYANLDYDIPITPRTVFYSGSVSKQFTAASVLLLARQGKVSLDDDVRRWIPELPDYGRSITIRHLIHHTSGLRDIYVLMDLAGIRLEDVFPDEDAIALIAAQKELNFAPGDEHLYSNSGYFLLAQIVKRATGRSLREYADEQLFRPLGMSSTHFHDEPDHIIKHRAISYQPDGRGGFRISYLTNFDKIGAGGLYTTIDDMAKWDANFLHASVGGAPFIAEMHERGALSTGDTLAYAAGLTVGGLRGLTAVRHSGSMMGFQAHYLRLPEQHFSAVALCNLGTVNPGALLDRVAAVYFGDRMTAAPPRVTRDAAPGEERGAWPVEASALARYTGTYHSDELTVDYHIASRNGGLVLTRRIGAPVPLRAIDEHTFRAGNLQLRFQVENGMATGFTVQAGRVRNLRFSRIDRAER